MFECKKCKSTNIVSNLIETNIESGNDFYTDKEFGKVSVTIQVCWCSDCGAPHSSSILNISKLKHNRKYVK
jgi:hypothetical protein